MSFDERVRVQVVQFARLKLVRAANLQKCSIAGFGCFLRAVATDATVHIILIADAGRNLSCDQ